MLFLCRTKTLGKWLPYESSKQSRDDNLQVTVINSFRVGKRPGCYPDLGSKSIQMLPLLANSIGLASFGMVKGDFDFMYLSV